MCLQPNITNYIGIEYVSVCSFVRLGNVLPKVSQRGGGSSGGDYKVSLFSKF